MDSPQLMLSLIKTKDPAASSQKKVTILDDMKRVQWANLVQRCCSHVDPVKVLRDRNPCLMYVPLKRSQH